MKDITDERDNDLINSYISLKKSDPELRFVRLSAILKKVLAMGAPRFYLSLDVARAYIQYKKRGIYPPNLKEPLRRQMCDDLYARYCEMKEKYPDCYEYYIIEKTIYSHAPSFYLKESTAVSIVRRKL